MLPNPKIDEIIEKFVTKGRADSPGCSLAVAKDGKLFYSQAYGMADLDHDLKNTPYTAFFAASLSKQFTAMSILLLCKRKDKNGKPVVDLDADVRDYLNELTHLPKKVTVRQLLHHTSGIRDMLIQLTLAGWRWGDDMISGHDVLDLASRMKTLNFDPGQQFAYSNTNYFLASEIVRRRSDEKSLAEFARKNIFEPLKMTSTRFVESYCETVKNRACGYRSRKNEEGFEKRTPNYNLTGPTNLFTTAEDLLRWDANFDSAVVGGANAIATLQQPGENADGYALGLYVVKDANNKTQKLWHNGRTIGHRAHFYRDNLHGVSVALLCNVEFEDIMTTDNIVFAVSQAAQKKPAPGPTNGERLARYPDQGHALTASALDKYCGKYFNSEINTEFEVATKGTSLVILRPKYPPISLTHFGGDTFIVQDFTAVLREVEFTFLRNGNDITEFQLDWSRRIGGSRLMNFRFVRQKPSSSARATR